MATISCYLSKKVLSETNETELLFRLSISRELVFRVHSKIYVNPNSWNSKKEILIKGRLRTEDNLKLANLQMKIDTLKSLIIQQCCVTPPSSITKEWINNIIYVFHFGEPQKGSSTSESPFVETFRLFIQAKAKNNMRKRQFECVIRMLQRFELYKKDFVLNLNTFSDTDLMEFKSFLQIEHSFFKKGECIKYAEIYKQVPESRPPKMRGENTIFSIMKRFRTFYNWAIYTKRTTNNPFTKFKLDGCVYGTPFYLTSEERDYLYNFDFSNYPSLEIQRDIFVFQSLVGMRVGDFMALTYCNLVNKGIEYIPSKTANEIGNTIRVPLNSTAMEIINKYYSKERNMLFPFISPQKYNVAIKKMLRIANIDRIVTIINPTTRKEEQHPIYEVASSHMARRNFIGNLYSKTQDPNTIGAMTGHVNGSKAFARYRNIDDDVKKALVNLL